jgi:lipid-A-disaccharide synthase-like uncharacterized protein
MGDVLLMGLAAIGVAATVLFALRHGIQFVAWAKRARTSASAIPAEVQVRLLELERVVRQHDAVLSTVVKPIPQPAAPAATPPV